MCPTVAIVVTKPSDAVTGEDRDTVEITADRLFHPVLGERLTRCIHSLPKIAAAFMPSW